MANLLGTPYVMFNKDEIVKSWVVVKVPYKFTWSCCEGGKKLVGYVVRAG